MTGAALRSYRADSWIRRADELAKPDDNKSERELKSILDERFIFYWIGLNALYGQAKYRQEKLERTPELVDLVEFVRLMHRLDRSQALTKTLSDLTDQKYRLLGDCFLDDRCWKVWDKKGLVDQDARERSSTLSPNAQFELEELFKKLYVLRKQIFHGCATRGSSKTGMAVKDAVAVLERFLPILRNIVKSSEAGERLLNYPPYPPSEDRKNSGAEVRKRRRT